VIKFFINSSLYRREQTKPAAGPMENAVRFFLLNLLISSNLYGREQTKLAAGPMENAVSQLIPSLPIN